MIFGTEGLTQEFYITFSELLDKCSSLGILMIPYMGIVTPLEQAKKWCSTRTPIEIAFALDKLNKLKCHYLASTIEEVRDTPCISTKHITYNLPGQSWHQYGAAVKCVWDVNGRAEWSTSKQVELSNGEKVNGYRFFNHMAYTVGLGIGSRAKGKYKNWQRIQQNQKAVLQQYTWINVNDVLKDMYSH